MQHLAVDQAVRWGYIPRNPAAEAARYAEVETPRRALSEEEEEKLLAQLHPGARPFVVLALETGMRRSELDRLAWEDVDLGTGVIVVRDRKAKNFSVLSITRRARVELERLLKEREKENVKSLYVLPRNELGKPIDHKRAIGRGGMRAGIGWVTPHMLRHTFATRALDAGAELYDVQAALGHKTPAMTMRYDHGRPHRAQRVTEAIERSRQLAKEDNKAQASG